MTRFCNEFYLSLRLHPGTIARPFGFAKCPEAADGCNDSTDSTLDAPHEGIDNMILREIPDGNMYATIGRPSRSHRKCTEENEECQVGLGCCSIDVIQ